jgi:hypothetical protein
MTIPNKVYTDHEFLDKSKTSTFNAEPDDAFLYNWIFHFNAYTGLWNAIPRDYYKEYWNDSSCQHVISSKSIDTLQEIIYKTGGDKNKIEKLISE